MTGVNEHPDQTGPEPRKRFGLPMVLGLIIWAGLLVGAFGAIATYGYKEGSLSDPPEASELGLALPEGRWTLVVTIHPKCPCTSATVYEAERLLRRAGRELDLLFVVAIPEAKQEDWDVPGEIKRLVPNSRVELLRDPDGALCAELGASTSGSTVLYDPEGIPRYWGGITPSRGHSGDNIGSDAIIGHIRGEAGQRRVGPVYGCTISDDGENPACCEDVGEDAD